MLPANSESCIPEGLRNETEETSEADLTIFKEIARKMLAEDCPTVEVFIPVSSGSLIFSVTLLGTVPN